MSTFLKRRELVILFYAIPSIFLLLEFYLAAEDSLWRTVGNQLITWAIIIWTFSYLLGCISLFRYHWHIIERRRTGFEFSILLFVAFFAFLGLGFLKSATGIDAYTWILVNMLLPLQIGMLSYVGFYMYTVFFRGARTRSWEAGLLLVSSILIMAYQAPAGPAWWSGFETIGAWIKNVPNTAGMRGVLIGVAVGMVALFVRTILGLERAQLGER